MKDDNRIDGERARTEIAPRESERFLSTLISNLPGWVYRCRNDQNWTMEYISPGIEQITGYAPPAFLKSDEFSFGDIIHEDDRTHVWAAVQEAIDKGEAFQVTYRIQTAKGEERWMWEQGRAVEAPDGEAGEVLLEGFITDITEAKRAEDEARRTGEQLRVLLRELDHRVRNNLASLVALIDISSRSATSVQEFADAMRHRVQAMSTAHGLLSQTHHAPLDFASMIAALLPTEVTEAVELHGPPVTISSRQCTAFGMVFQELITNALKHGSLKVPAGRINVSWDVVSKTPREGDSGAPKLKVSWRESGGPPVRAPLTGRVGTTLIKGLVQTELRGEVDLNYPETGACHTILMGLDTYQ